MSFFQVSLKIQIMVNIVDPEAEEPKTFTMPFGGAKPLMINVNPEEETK